MIESVLHVMERGSVCDLALHVLNSHSSNELRSKGETVYRFGFGQSPFPVPPCVTKALQRHAHEKDYLPVRGTASTEHLFHALSHDFRACTYLGSHRSARAPGCH